MSSEQEAGPSRSKRPRNSKNYASADNNYCGLEPSEIEDILRLEEDIYFSEEPFIDSGSENNPQFDSSSGTEYMESDEENSDTD